MSRFVTIGEANTRRCAADPELAAELAEAARELAAEWAAAPKRWLHCLGRDETQVRASMSHEDLIGHAMAAMELPGRMADYEIVEQGVDLRIQLRHEIDGA